MAKILNFLKKNWLLLLIIILGYFLIENKFTLTYKPLPTGFSSRSYDHQETFSSPGSYEQKSLLPLTSPPAPEVKDRLVVQNSTLSLLVKNVKSARNKITQKARKLGGYMVESEIRSPQQIDSATVIIRVPEKKLRIMLVYIRSLGVRVVSENLIGYDVTDKYVDLKARLSTLEKTKQKFEDILKKANKITDILQVQQELINLQEQIDDLKGQQQYLEKSAQTAKITVYLSTDEYSLPYTPTQPWRPKVVFKTAVRSLVSTLRAISSFAIWVVVFTPIWLPLLIIYLFLKKRRK